MRDCFEIVNLVDWFCVDQSQISRWKGADEKTLRKDFKPSAVRKALAAMPQYAGQNRQVFYAMFSRHAAHVTYEGFQLIAPGNEPKLGPFFGLKFLAALLQEMGPTPGACGEFAEYAHQCRRQCDGAYCPGTFLRAAACLLREAHQASDAESLIAVEVRVP